MNLWAKLSKSQKAYGQGTQWSHEFKNRDIFITGICSVNSCILFFFSKRHLSFFLRCSVW